jgi:hypothetical protein
VAGGKCNSLTCFGFRISTLISLIEALSLNDIQFGHKKTGNKCYETDLKLDTKITLEEIFLYSYIEYI